MSIQEQGKRIIDLVKIRRKIKTRDIVALFRVSRQYVNLLLNNLITEEKLIKVGSTKNAFYVLPQYASGHLEIFPTRVFKRLKNSHLEEYRVLEQIENNCPFIIRLKENVRGIFEYAFTEMLNNAIEHSRSTYIDVEIVLKDGKLNFLIADYGIGVFRNIVKKKKLNSAVEAVQEILKGKATTEPRAHTGEGIFFTSKTADIYTLDSYGTQMVINNKIKANDIFIGKSRIIRKGTRVSFTIGTVSNRHIKDVFDEFTDAVSDGDFGFNKTEIKIKLFTEGSAYISRSQARRILMNLEKFNTIILDFDKVSMVGQSFADEIFRVFHEKYPGIRLKPINTTDMVQFMINRAEGRNPRRSKLLDDN